MQTHYNHFTLKQDRQFQKHVLQVMTGIQLLHKLNTKIPQHAETYDKHKQGTFRKKISQLKVEFF